MSTNAPENGRRRVVVAPVLDNRGVSIVGTMPIWIASAVIHIAILGLFYFLCQLVPSLVPSAWAGGQESLQEEVATTTQVEEQPKEFDLTNTQKGMLFSAFALAYALFEVPSGWLGDVFGPRRTLQELGLRLVANHHLLSEDLKRMLQVRHQRRR